MKAYAILLLGVLIQLVTLAIVVVASFANAVNDSTRDSGAIAPRSRAERENRLRPLLAQAGKPNGTFLLEARFPSKVALIGEPIDIILSVKNVGSDLKSFGWCIGETEADVWVKDENGGFVSLTNQGRQCYEDLWFLEPVHGWFSERVRPGDARGCTYRLTRYFAIDKPGKYTVFIAKSIDLATLTATGEAQRCVLVARPVTLDVIGKRQPRAIAEAPFRDKGPSDNEWKTWSAQAGKPADRCVLEAMESPVRPGSAELIVSLACEELPREFDSREIAAANAMDYQILVRDSVDRLPVPFHPAPDASRMKSTKTAKPPYHLRSGDAMGGLIPLRKYFELKEGREYWILVRLPSRKASGGDWVAEPIKIRYDPRPEKEKRKG